MSLSSPSLPASRRRYVFLLWALVAAVPVGFIANTAIEASRNIVYWDEFDTALDLVLRIDMGAGWRELLERFFAVSNEHRTVTSRLMFALSYWLTGTVNFHVIGAIGNLFLVGACGTLLLVARGWESRVRLGVILAFLLFQLENFENFIWSGASIDHYQVVMLAVLTMALLARGSQKAWAVAMATGVLATFTLAHGCLCWPIGALLLGYQRRWNQLVGWCAVGVMALAAFFHGFALNPGHHIATFSVAHVAKVARYWFALLGGPLTLGDVGFALIPGVALLVGLAVVTWRGSPRREPVAYFSALFAVSALALVACGRAEVSGDAINSRYLVLGALAWALLLYLLLEFATPSDKPFRVLLCTAPALVVFNVVADLKFIPAVEGFVEIRDRAATRFKQFGEDGKGIWRLHPQDGHAEVLLQRAAARGIYRLPHVSEPAEFPGARPTVKEMVLWVDELYQNDRAVTVGGWAMLPGEVSKRGQVYLMLKAGSEIHYYSTLTLQRPDVARAYEQPDWRLCGFRAVIGRTRLPEGDFEVGVLIDNDEGGEYKMTTHELHLTKPDVSRPMATAVR